MRGTLGAQQLYMFKNILRTFETEILEIFKNIQPHKKKESISKISKIREWRNLQSSLRHEGNKVALDT